MVMQLSVRGANEIIDHEAICQRRYLDSVGVATIGIGHTKSAGGVNPDAITRQLSVEECLRIFEEDIEKFERRVRKAFDGTDLEQHEFDAAVSFDFNTGGIHKASWVTAFKAGNVEDAKRRFMMWKKPPEIIPRRKKERDLFFGGKYTADDRALVIPNTTSRGKPDWSSAREVDISTELRTIFGPGESKTIDRPTPNPGTAVQHDWFGILLNVIRSIFS